VKLRSRIPNKRIFSDLLNAKRFVLLIDVILKFLRKFLIGLADLIDFNICLNI
jgi:hypothetical protein